MPARSLRGLDDLDRAALGVYCSRAFRVSGLRLDRVTGSTLLFSVRFKPPYQSRQFVNKVVS